MHFKEEKEPTKKIPSFESLLGRIFRTSKTFFSQASQCRRPWKLNNNKDIQWSVPAVTCRDSLLSTVSLSIVNPINWNNSIYWHRCGCPVSLLNGIYLPLRLLLFATIFVLVWILILYEVCAQTKQRTCVTHQAAFLNRQSVRSSKQHMYGI